MNLTLSLEQVYEHQIIGIEYLNHKNSSGGKADINNFLESLKRQEKQIEDLAKCMDPDMGYDYFARNFSYIQHKDQVFYFLLLLFFF